MRTLIVVTIVLGAIVAALRADRLAERFVNAKIANDSSIALDTKRLADAAERAHPPVLAVRP